MADRYLDILAKPEDDQEYIARTTSNSRLLDILSNSESVLVKMAVLSNPSISFDTLNRIIDDENETVWRRAQELMDSRKKLA